MSRTEAVARDYAELDAEQLLLRVHLREAARLRSRIASRRRRIDAAPPLVRIAARPFAPLTEVSRHAR